MAEEHIQLDYARRRGMPRRWVRRWVILALLAGIAVPAWKWGPGAWRQTQLLYWQHRCLTYTLPADQVVYEEDPAKAAALLASDSAYRAFPLNRIPNPSSTQPVSVAAAYTPPCWPRLVGCAPFGAFQRMYTSRKSVSAIIFLHEMWSPNGTRYLVAIVYMPEASSFQTGFYQGYNWLPMVARPASLRAPLQWMQQPGGYDFSIPAGWPRTPPDVRIFAGRADPHDSSRFTIRYQMWGEEDMLDGNIDDSGHVVLKQRNPPKWR